MIGDFNGIINHSFWDLFEAFIHNSTDISDVDKYSAVRSIPTRQSSYGVMHANCRKGTRLPIPDAFNRSG